MQDRIDRLESLVLSLVTNGSSNTPATANAALSGRHSVASTDTLPVDDDEMKESQEKDDSEVEQVSQSIGVMKVANDRQIFASDAHWFAILSDIAEVKSYFAEHKKVYEEQAQKVSAYKGTGNIGAGLLFKGVATTDESEIRANFPNRSVSNLLITRYFDAANPATHILHRPTFCKQYERYWGDPQWASLPWIGMCFGMMALALQSYYRAGDEPMEFRDISWQQSLRYIELATQSIVRADMTQPTTHMIEALCLYLQAESARSKDAETGVWMFSGVLTRLAMRIGLHRDPRPYASLTPFQGEMRRRVWNFIRSMDVMFSFQVGLPVMIKSSDCDTAFPANIYDEEFGEDTKSLPPSRPLSERTPMSFMIVSSHFTFVLARIIETSSSIALMPYEETTKLDGELREVRAQIPPLLQLKSREDSALDPASLIMQRFTLDLLYHKSLVVLHRRYLSGARENARFEYSRQRCVESCMEMLKHQVTIHTECQPGGRLQAIPWSVTSSITIHDFLLAAMIVALDLYRTASAESKGQTADEGYAWGLEHRDEMFTGLERSLSIWESMRDQSMEAFKATTILQVMLTKLRNHQALRQQLSSNFSFASNHDGTPADHHVAPEHSAAMTLGMMASGGMTPDPANMYERGYIGQGMGQQLGSGVEQGAGMAAPAAQMSQGQSQGQQDINPFSNLFGPGGFQAIDMAPSANLDWDDWATYIQGASMDTSAQGMVFDPAFTTGEANGVGQAQSGQLDGQQTMSMPNLFAPGGKMFAPGVGSPPQA
ncbi:MAG: hypothetical protein M1828_006315 [Chrysothrix sp. TS-e1954]|nr:MAG: hypothetical protein M1828_006315 [Chrysothrix sp. TS-e1954]